MLKRQRPKCARVKANGEPCSQYVLTKEGLESLRDQGVDLVADAERYCGFHARSAWALHEMQSRGGVFSKQRHDERQAEKIQAALEARDPMPREIVARVQPALKELLRAKLPGTRESDVRSVALGAYVAVHMYCAAEDRERLLQQLLPADLQIRDDLWTTAEDELRDMIEELPPEQRDAVWELLATTPA